MKLTLRVQLVPDAAGDDAVRRTTERFSEAAHWTAGVLFEHRISNQRKAQTLVYRQLRDRFGLTAQMAILVIHRVCEACKPDKEIRPKFRKDAASTHDPRVMRFIGLDKVKLWTTAGRLVIPMRIGPYQAERIGFPKGQADLLRREGKWFLFITVDVPDGTSLDPHDFLGVDLGIANLATDSDGAMHSGAGVETLRKKHNRQRKRLQRKGTNGARKKRLAGVVVAFIDPAYTSQTCHGCGHCERFNRKSQDRFHSQACGHQAHADQDAARSIRAQALSKRASGLGARLAG
jgi:predicted transposase